MLWLYPRKTTIVVGIHVVVAGRAGDNESLFLSLGPTRCSEESSPGPGEVFRAGKHWPRKPGLQRTTALSRSTIALASCRRAPGAEASSTLEKRKLSTKRSFLVDSHSVEIDPFDQLVFECQILWTFVLLLWVSVFRFWPNPAAGVGCPAKGFSWQGRELSAVEAPKTSSCVESNLRRGLDSLALALFSPSPRLVCAYLWCWSPGRPPWIEEVGSTRWTGWGSIVVALVELCR